MSRLPDFLVKRIPKQNNMRKMRLLLDDSGIHTVCEEARCPNIGECFLKKTCTFMILGSVCTRNCAFCALPAGRQGVKKGTPLPPDPEEPKKIAEAAKKLGLDYVVVTSVTRDDLPDGGAGQFAKVIAQLRMSNAECRIEVLIPDFNGKAEALQTVLYAKPYVLNHNIETVPRLYPKIRPQANYEHSLNILLNAKQSGKVVYTKSGFMVGLGETRDEIIKVLEDLKETGCDIVTIGQYLSPSREHIKPERFVLPEEFEAFRSFGKSLGFLAVFSGPFVRSSYHAAEILNV